MATGLRYGKSHPEPPRTNEQHGQQGASTSVLTRSGEAANSVRPAETSHDRTVSKTVSPYYRASASGPQQRNGDANRQSGEHGARDVRSTRFWYSDGSVVIRVEGTLFRLYGGLLEQTCTYFASLLKSSRGLRVRATGRAPDVDRAHVNYASVELVEGCLVYTVDDDLCTVADFEHFLRGLSTPL